MEDIGNRTAEAGRLARLVGLIGSIPFVVLAIWLYGIQSTHPWHEITIRLLTTYAAVVLSFLGGLRWGLALGGSGSGGAVPVMLGCLPALAGWAGVFMSVPYGFAMLAVALAAQGAWDALTLHDEQIANQFLRSRMWLTAIAVASMVIAFVATA